MNDKIKELKDLLFELDNKHSVSVPDTQQNINDVAKKIVKLFAIPVVVGRSEQLCDHPRSERSYIGQNMLRCNKCGKEFS